MLMDRFWRSRVRKASRWQRIDLDGSFQPPVFCPEHPMMFAAAVASNGRVPIPV